MTASVVPTEEKPVIEPTRSMTHPLRDPKPQGARRKPKQGAPLDAEDLSRRLNLHLNQQRERAEASHRKRQAKAAADAGIYHHVPSVAASAFERTMTPDAMRIVPKIAQSAIKAHLETLKSEATPGSPQVTLLRQTQARDQSTLDRQLLASRNQFQWTPDLENANEADMERDLFKPPQRTFAEFAYLKSQKTPRTGPRPLSTGDMVWDFKEESSKPKARPLQVSNERNGRHDWAQRDDERRSEKTNPLLRKRESNWILSGIRSMKQDRGAENNDISPPDTTNLPKMRGGIFARFKRNPS